MQRIMVDLPEPEGPQTTTRSPSATLSDTSRSTCNAPNHLLTLSSRIAGGASVRAVEATCSRVSLMCYPPHRRRWRFSSASRPWLYRDMAKQKTK